MKFPRHFAAFLLLSLLFCSLAFAQNNLHDFTSAAIGGAQSTKLLVSTGVALIGTTPTQIPSAVLTLTASATNYIYVDTVAGTISFNTSGFTATDYPVATAVTDSIHITSLTDDRWGAYAAAGSSTGGTVTSATIAGTSGQLNVAGTCTITTSGTCTISIPSSFYTNASFFPFQSITTTGTSGAATLSGGVLNIPQYPGSGLSGMTATQIPVAATASTITSSIATTNPTYFPFQSLSTTGSNCAGATLSTGALNIPPCTGGGSLPSGNTGLALRNTTGSTTYAAASVAGGIDATQFLTGSVGTCTPGTNDDACIANAIAAVPGTPSSGSGGYAVIDDSNAGAQVWTTNPFKSLLSNGTSNITAPVKCGQLILSGGSTVTTNVPITVPRCWDVKVVSQFGQAATIVASSSWPGIYTTGTVTTAAPTTISSGQYQFVVTGVGTTFTSNVVVGEEFGICQGTNNPGANGPSCGGNGTTTCSVACGTNTAGQLTYGMVLAVTDNTHLIIGTANANTGVANASGVNYVIKAPLIWLGAMGADSGDSGGASATWHGGTISCANKAGCSAFVNFSEQENSSITDVVIENVVDTYLDVEGINAVNSGPYDRMVMNASASCTSATRAIITRIPGSLHPISNTTVNFGGCTTGAGEVAIDFEEGGDLGPGIHFEGNNTSTNIVVDVGENSGGVPMLSCPVYCPQPVNIAAGSHIHDLAVTGTGQTGINMGSNADTQIETENNTVSFTNVIADNARSCNIISGGGDSTVTRYDHLYNNGWFGTAQTTTNACGSGSVFGGTITFNGSTSGSATIGASATGSLLDLNGINATVSTGGALTVTSCTGCGSGGPGTGTQYTHPYWSTTSALGSVAPTTGYDGVPQVETNSTTSGAFTAAPVSSPQGVPVDLESGSTFTVALTDRYKVLNTTNGTTSTAVTVPAPSTTGFGLNFVFAHLNSGSVVATDTPTTATVNGNSTMKLVGAVAGHNPEAAFWWEDSSTSCSSGPCYWGAEILPTDANGQLAAEGLNVANACPTCVVASSPGVGIAHFAGSTQTVTSSTIATGDIAANAVTLAKLATQGANTVLANVTGGTAVPTAASIPAGVQFYTAATGYSAATSANLLGVCTTCVTSASSLGSGNVMTGAGSQGSQTDASAALSGGALTLGVSGTAGTALLYPASGNFTTTLGSAATASNTFVFPATVFTTGHLGYCATSSTTCTWTDAGYSYNALPLADHATQTANTLVANVTGSTAVPTAAAIPAGVQFYTAGTGYSAATAAQLGTVLNIASGLVLYSGGTAAAPVGSTDWSASATTLTSAAAGTLNMSASTGAPSIQLPAVVGGTILAGTSTANLSAPVVIQNTNSSNNNTSITMGVSSPGTSTGQTTLNVNCATTQGNCLEAGTGGTWTAGVLSGQTKVFQVLPTGQTTLGTGPTVAGSPTSAFIIGTTGTCPTSQASAGFLCPSSSSDNTYYWNVNNASVNQHLPQTAITSGSAYTNATTSFTSVAGGSGQTLAFTVAASTNYVVTCNILWQGSAGTTGPKFQWTGPASPTAVTASMHSPVTTATYLDATATAFSSPMADTGTITTATNFNAVVTLGLVNGTTGGTVTLQAAANGTGTLTIQPGSFCQIQ